MNLGRHVMMASVIVSSALMGCASPKSYLGASFPKVTFEDVQKRDAPLHLRLAVEFQRNGQHFSKGDIPLRDYATRIFRESGVISPIDMLSPGDEKEEGTVKVVLNNIADSGTVAAETARTGFPLWMVGKTITDAYEMSMSITTRGKTISRSGIKHAFHTAIGNIDIPDHLQPFPSDEAFGRMLRQMIVKALIDMQKSGEL
ncbi:hypothetical protein SAMN05216420_10497 [Nitrosospira sp. Nl5]|uniref:hypothetical protein n=1 Tax=Nitrosospira sp. Nl5 TaxID=200120 RepID=UPI000886C151|nr:hypothetical protein [Nitrosospira sp. Nl5]SCY28222.1 hypothetical protein SAMN05216420_10497 [Nitrosospira sp. Nl5]